MSHLLVPGIAFAIASSPATFKLTRKVAGPWVSSFEGVATPAGLFLHTLFFLFILYLVGRFMPRKSGFGNLIGYEFGKGEHETHRAARDNIGGYDLVTTKE
jgi:hypothetical protein